MKTTLEKIPLHAEFDEATRLAVEEFNNEVQGLRDERAGNDAELNRIVTDALNNISPAGELIKRTFALRVHRLAADMDSLKLPLKLAAAEDSLRAFWQRKREESLIAERERRAKLEKLADELGYGNPSRERHGFILQDTERRRLEEAAKNARQKADEKLDHAAASALMDEMEKSIKAALSI